MLTTSYPLEISVAGNSFGNNLYSYSLRPDFRNMFLIFLIVDVSNIPSLQLVRTIDASYNPDVVFWPHAFWFLFLDLSIIRLPAELKQLQASNGTRV